MNDTQLIVIALGIVAVCGLAVLAYFGKKTAEIAGLVKPMFDLLIERADTALVPYGDALQPLHGMIEAAGQAIDEDTDPLVKALQSPAIVAALREVLRQAQALTDGKAESEEVNKFFAELEVDGQRVKG